MQYQLPILKYSIDFLVSCVGKLYAEYKYTRYNTTVVYVKHFKSLIKK